MSGIGTDGLEIELVSINCRWPKFGSAIREAEPWGRRCPALVSSIKKYKNVGIVAAQECGDLARGGQARDLYRRLGMKYDAFVLNAVGWDDDVYKLDYTIELGLPAHGQYPGRTFVAVALSTRDTYHGDHLKVRVASTHLATHSNSPKVSDAQAKAYRGEQFQKILSKYNDDKSYPSFICMDGNSKATELGSKTPRALGRKYGWEWPAALFGGIDIVMSNYGAKIDESKTIEMGTASDHDGRYVRAHTELRSADAA